jgi:phosphoribosylformylglycinamidine synthase
VVATGARPAAVTDCLNFGNPEKPEVFWQLKEAVEGMAEACRALEVPVVSGNVSLYNDTSGVSIYPSPVVGMVGLIDDVERRVQAGFREPGDTVVLLGETRDELGGSEYQRTVLGQIAGSPPRLDLDAERRAHQVVLAAAEEGLLKSAHDLSDGGLAIAVAECCLIGLVGTRCEVEAVHHDPVLALFSESQSRFLISCAPQDQPRLDDLARRFGVLAQVIGVVGGETIQIGPHVSEPLDAARQTWERALD